MAAFEDALGVLLAHEGGFTDHPSDPGGATNYGISLRYLEESGIDPNEDGTIDLRDVRNLTLEKASSIYRTYWWDPMFLSQVNDQVVATKVFGMAVNMGIGTGVRLLQEVLVLLGQVVSIDGRMGPQTINATNGVDPRWIMAELRCAAAKRYRDLIDRNPKLNAFRIGWMRRAYA